MRDLFRKELTHLRDMLAEMGGLADGAMCRTIEAVRDFDMEKATAVIAGDDQIDKLEHYIEQSCMSLIARQQPLAKDLRVIAATLKVITDVERVADQCCDICEILRKSPSRPDADALAGLSRLLRRSHDMFSAALSACLSRNAEHCEQICRDDDEVDALYERLILDLCSQLSQNTDQTLGTVNLMFVAKYAERIADHATNIAEWTIYMAEATHPELN